MTKKSDKPQITSKTKSQSGVRGTVVAAAEIAQDPSAASQAAATQIFGTPANNNGEDAEKVRLAEVAKTEAEAKVKTDAAAKVATDAEAARKLASDEAEKARLDAELERVAQERKLESKRQGLVTQAKDLLRSKLIRFETAAAEGQLQDLILELSPFADNVESKRVRADLTRRVQELSLLKQHLDPLSFTRMAEALEGVVPTDNEILTSELKQINARLHQGRFSKQYPDNESEIAAIEKRISQLIDMREGRVAPPFQPVPAFAPAQGNPAATPAAPKVGLWTRFTSFIRNLSVSKVVFVVLLIIVFCLSGVIGKLVWNAHTLSQGQTDTATASIVPGLNLVTGNGTQQSASTLQSVQPASANVPTCSPLCNPRADMVCDDSPGHAGDSNCCRRIVGGTSREGIFCPNNDYNHVNNLADDLVATGTYDWSSCQICQPGATPRW